MKSLNIVGNEGCYLRRYSKIASLGSDKQKIRTLISEKSNHNDIKKQHVENKTVEKKDCSI